MPPPAHRNTAPSRPSSFPAFSLIEKMILFPVSTPAALLRLSFLLDNDLKFCGGTLRPHAYRILTQASGEEIIAMKCIALSLR